MPEPAQNQETQPLVVQEGPRIPKALILVIVALLVLVVGELAFFFLFRGKPAPVPSQEEVSQERALPARGETEAQPLTFTVFSPTQPEELIKNGYETTFDSPESVIMAKLPLETPIFASFSGQVSLGGGFPGELDYNFVQLNGDGGYSLLYYFPGEVLLENGDRVAAKQEIGRVTSEELSFLEGTRVNLLLRLLKDGQRQSLRPNMIHFE